MKRSIGALLSLSVLIAAGRASAGPARVGPVDSATGYPMWYEDANGLTLQLCDTVNADLICLVGPDEIPSPLLPLSVNVDAAGPHNFGLEAFWYAAEASLDNPHGKALLVLALEAAFLPEEIARANEIAFGRVRVVLDVPNPARGTTATYVVTHPYGVERFVVAHEASRDPRKPPLPTVKIFFTEDIGADVPRNFAGALGSRIAPFLVPTGFNPADPLCPAPPPDGYIGDSASECPVQGSPHGTNFFRVEGPGFPPGGLQTDRFTVTGKVAKKFGAEITRATYTRGVWDPGIEVFAFSHQENAAATPPVPPQTLWATARKTDGTGETKEMVRNAATGKYFAFFVGDYDKDTLVTVMNMGDLANGYDTASTSGVVDYVQITEAYYNRVLPANVLEVVALSSDDVTPGVFLEAFDESGASLGKLQPGVEGPTLLLTTTVPPTEVTVRSFLQPAAGVPPISLGGSAKAVVSIGLCKRAGTSLQCVQEPKK
jgi:hypothetical protein